MFTQLKTETNYERERLINLLASYGIKENIILAFEAVPREKFIEKRFIEAAYEDRALPIGESQTISQPSLVAEMLQSLELGGGEKVLEVGTGSGYQASLLAKLAKKVYTIERIEKLAKEAEKHIKSIGVKNVEVIVGDGTRGLAKHAPYNAIIVSAAFREIPQPFASQLKEDGRLIMPVGEQDSQEVILYQKKAGILREIRRISPVRFVPLVGKYGWQ